MRLLTIAILLVCGSAFAGLTFDEKQLLERYYKQAMDSFAAGGYTDAIKTWQEILRIDPTQSSPTQLIRQARQKLAGQISVLEKAGTVALKNGDYTSALARFREAEDMDPSDNAYDDRISRLSAICDVASSETRQNKAGSLIRLGVSKWAQRVPDMPGALDAFRYAMEVSSSEAVCQRFIGMIEQERPDLAREPAPAGTSILDEKLLVALNNFYEGRYDLTIQKCREVLSLDAGNKTAMERMGSAYWALGQKTRARDIWKQALKLDPNNRRLQRFVQGGR